MKLEHVEINNLTKSLNESLILSVLSNKKLHGYQLALEIEEKSNGLFKFNHGTLYPILHKIEKEGLILGTWKQEGPKRKRKYYKITAKGKKHITSQFVEWQDIYKLFFNILREIEK